VSGRWRNVHDRLNVVALLDAKLVNDYCRNGGCVVDDLKETSYGRWRHDIGRHLRGSRLRTHITDMLSPDPA
jgi:hypothetical protein